MRLRLFVLFLVAAAGAGLAAWVSAASAEILTYVANVTALWRCLNGCR